MIGCGPSGISILSAFSEANMNGGNIPEVVCFEKQDAMCSLWNYTWIYGLDEHGEYVHGSMYKSLWTNNPKGYMELTDYTFNDHFKLPLPSFLPSEPIRDYLFRKARKYGIEKYVRFNTVVRFVHKKGNHFVLTSEHLLKGMRRDEEFDYVIVATGHYSIPHFPSFPGLDKYPGRILHSHDFKKAEEF